MIIVLALADVLRRSFVPFRVLVRLGRDRRCLRGSGGQCYQTYQRWDDYSHFSLCRWGDNEASLQTRVLTKAEAAWWAVGQSPYSSRADEPDTDAAYASPSGG